MSAAAAARNSRSSSSRQQKRKLRVGRSLLLCVLTLPVASVVYLALLTHQGTTTRKEAPEVHPKGRRASHHDPTTTGSRIGLPVSSLSSLHVSSAYSSLPSWAKEYIGWYRIEKEKLTNENWTSQRYLILQCLMEDPHCGGTSDRLKPLPLLLRLAYMSKRLLMIRWTRPCALEEFLVPPTSLLHGYNWTVPSWLVPHLQDHQENGELRARLPALQRDIDKNITVLRTRIQVFDGGSAMFDELMQGSGDSYRTIYHALFRIFFEPSSAVQRILTEEMNAMGIVAGDYATAHYRAYYGNANKNHSDDTIAKFAINAVNCASQLRPGGPVYFTSDARVAIDTVRTYAKENKNKNNKIVTIENQQPIHLDKADVMTSPSHFYSVFVDLLLLGDGRCGSFGEGGFGRYGLLVSYNASCSIRHTLRRKMQTCEWVDG